MSEVNDDRFQTPEELFDHYKDHDADICMIRDAYLALKSELSAKDERVKELEKFVKKHYQYILDHVKMHSYSGHLSDAMDTVVRHESWSAAQRHFEMCFPQLTQQHTTKSNELQSSGKG
jgi:hypothetical protein